MHFCVLYFWYDIMMLMELNSKCTEGIIMSVKRGSLQANLVSTAGLPSPAEVPSRSRGVGTGMT